MHGCILLITDDALSQLDGESKFTTNYASSPKLSHFPVYLPQQSAAKHSWHQSPISCGSRDICDQIQFDPRNPDEPAWKHSDENSPEIRRASGNYQTSELMCFVTQLRNTVEISPRSRHHQVAAASHIFQSWSQSYLCDWVADASHIRVDSKSVTFTVTGDDSAAIWRAPKH